MFGLNVNRVGWWGSGGQTSGGTVTSVSVVSANGFSGSVATPNTTPSITLSTTITGVLKGNGTAISAAVDGTDYVSPAGVAELSNKTGLISQWTNNVGYLTSLAGAVTSVSGTENRITSSGGATPVIDINSGYVGQASITTVGTLTSGATGAGFTVALGLSTITGTLSPVNGGTGIANNVASTITISGNFATTFTVSGVTGVTFPTSGTLYGTATGSITSAQLLASMSDKTGSGVVVFGTSPTFTTDITTPLLIGGSGVSSKIDYKSTTGVGTSTVVAHEFWGGNNGATNLFGVYNDAQFLVNTTTRNPSALGTFRVGQGSNFLDIGEVSASGGAGIWGGTALTNSTTNYGFRTTGATTVLNATTTASIATNNTNRVTVTASLITLGVRTTIATGVTPDGSGVKHGRVTTGSISAGATALVTLTWGTAFADANYTVSASVIDSTTSSLSLSVVHVESVSATAVTVRVLNNALGSLTGTLDVIAIHD